MNSRTMLRMDATPYLPRLGFRLGLEANGLRLGLRLRGVYPPDLDTPCKHPPTSTSSTSLLEKRGYSSWGAGAPHHCCFLKTLV